MGKQKQRLGEEQMLAVARAVADPRRFAILQQIAGHGVCACSVVREQQPISAATISHHIKELADAGLISIVHEGRTAELTFQRDLWERYLAQLAEI